MSWIEGGRGTGTVIREYDDGSITHRERPQKITQLRPMESICEDEKEKKDGFIKFNNFYLAPPILLSIKSIDNGRGRTAVNNNIK